MLLADVMFLNENPSVKYWDPYELLTILSPEAPKSMQTIAICFWLSTRTRQYKPYAEDIIYFGYRTEKLGWN